MTSSSSLDDSSDLTIPLEAGDLSGDLKSIVLLEDTKTADLDLPNILFAYSIPLPRDQLRAVYKKAQQNVHIWQAWEAARTEGLVHDKTRSKDLPSDNSYGSKLKRTAYRVKVIQWLRDHATWLTAKSIDNEVKNFDVQKSEASSVVLNTLSTLLSPPFREVDTLLRSISRGILEGRAFDQQYLFTFVTHTYDNALKAVLTTIGILSVSITIDHGSAQDRLKFSIGYTKSSLSFIHRQWDAEEGKIRKPVIEVGEKILGKKTLHLALLSSF